MDKILGIPEDDYDYEFMVVTKLDNGDYQWHSNHTSAVAYDVVKNVPNGMVAHNLRISGKQLRYSNNTHREIAKAPVMSSECGQALEG